MPWRTIIGLDGPGGAVVSVKLWSPSEDRINGTLLFQFLQRAERRYGVSLPTYDAAWQWSVDKPEDFWRFVWDFCEVCSGEVPGPTLRSKDSLIDAEFFPDATLNYAANLLQRRGNDAAIIFHSENGERRVLSWDELYENVSKISQALKDLGVEKGDRVAGFMPNMPETLVAMLATTALGAVWSSCSPDFGTQGVLDRFGQIEPKVLFTANGYHYNGKTFDCLQTVAELIPQIPSLMAVVVVPFTAENPDMSGLQGNVLRYPDVLEQQKFHSIKYQSVSFNDPLFIMFSSGTTGVPKCIVHRTGGVLLQHLKEHQLQCDIQPSDRVFYFTTCGWMMWNWLASALASQATIILYDGNPFYPDGNRLASLAEQERVTHFGTSAKYIDACVKANVEPAKTHDLPKMRTILSTGSALSPESFDYLYQSWKADCCVSSIAGGTDIVGCFVGGNPIGPVYRGEAQKRHLGMNVQAFDGSGRAVTNQPGELVCCSPHPSMPAGFWNDPDKERYRAAYFETYKNIWHHGDLIEVKDTGGVVFLGRSDATLNPGGVRIGTAEIYRQVDRIEGILDAVAIGQDWQTDVRIVLFVKLREDVILDDDLIKKIKMQIRNNTTPRHVPEKIIAVADIPRTKSGKTVELAVRDVIHGRAVRNLSALANPEALDVFKDHPQLST